jgi:prepilin-type N-terminal cleavage/methylation domain-containing protein
MCKKPALRAFTLVELLVVLTIVAVLAMVIAPYATRSNEGLSLEQECLNIVEVARFAMQCATDQQCPTRLAVDLKRHSYRVEIALDPGRQEYRPIEKLQGLQHALPPGVRVFGLDGFTATGDGSYVTFDPAANWPAADMSLLAGTTVKKVLIRGKQVEIAQESM